MSQNDDFFGSVWQKEAVGPSNDGWQTGKAPSRFGWKFLIGIFILLIVFGAAAAIFYVRDYFASDQEVDFNVMAAKEIFSGAPFNLKYNFSNTSKNTLKDVAVKVFLPENTLAVDGGPDKRFFTKSEGDLEPGADLNGEIGLVIFGDAGTLKNFSVTAAYSVNGVKFEKKQNLDAVVQGPSINFDLTAPEKILNNESFETAIHYVNLSHYNFSKIRISVIYPDKFILVKSTPLLNNNFLATSLAPGRDGALVLSGSAVGSDQSFLEIKARAEAFYLGDWHPVAEKAAHINFASSPLVIKISSDAPSYVSPGANFDYLHYELDYANNTDIALNDVVAKVWLKGEMFDFLTLKTNGAYESLGNTITWNAANAPTLKFLNPRTNGALKFFLKLKKQYPIAKISDKNFTLKIDAEISSPTVPYNVHALKTMAIDSLETKVGGALEVIPRIYFIEPLFPDIVNKGLLPPRVNRPINFTVHWRIKNYAADASNVMVKSILASGVKFTGLVKSNANSSPVVNERTGEVSWNIDKISANKGVASAPFEAVFQVEATPNTIDVHQPLKILQETFISGIDNFTNAELKNFGPAESTLNLSDPGFNANNGLVIEK